MEGAMMRKGAISTFGRSFRGWTVVLQRPSGRRRIWDRRGRSQKLDLKELVARIPKDYKPEELDWGPPVGREVW